MLWRRLRCFVRGRPVAVAVGVLVGAAIAYTGARVTSGAGLGGRVGSGVGVTISMAMAVVTVEVFRSAGQFSRVGGFVRNCANSKKQFGPVSETIASAIAHHARR
jgi:hypothetical protein